MWGTRIEGRVVRMRPILEAELPLLVEWSADTEVQRCAGSYHALAPGDVKECWVSAGSDPRAFHWGLEWKGRLVGRTAIRDVDWHARRAGTEILVGDGSAWRHGIATESIALLTEYAFLQLNLHKLQAASVEGDAGRVEALRRAGYRQIARFKEQHYRDGRWLDEIRTELLRADWEQEHPPS